MGTEHLIETFGTIGLIVIIFAESSVIFFLPGDSLLVTAGIFAAKGDLNLAVILIGTFVAAVAGNQVAYVVGARVGHLLFRPSSRLFKPEHAEKAERYFADYGTKTVVLARFVPAVRTFAPLMAGVGKMRYRVFVVFNVLGALLWTFGMTLLGFGLGNSVKDIDKYLLPLIALIVVVSALPVLYELRKARRAKL